MNKSITIKQLVRDISGVTTDMEDTIPKDRKQSTASSLVKTMGKSKGSKSRGKSQTNERTTYDGSPIPNR